MNVFLNIQTGSIHVIFSWNVMDPPKDDPNAATYHGPTHRGTHNVTLLAKDKVLPSFDRAVNSVSSTVAHKLKVQACMLMTYITVDNNHMSSYLSYLES